jgi:hypothetical protein
VAQQDKRTVLGAIFGIIDPNQLILDASCIPSEANMAIWRPAFTIYAKAMPARADRKREEE